MVQKPNPKKKSHVKKEGSPDNERKKKSPPANLSLQKERKAPASKGGGTRAPNALHQKKNCKTWERKKRKNPRGPGQKGKRSGARQQKEGEKAARS